MLKLSLNNRTKFLIAPEMECTRETMLQVWGEDHPFSETQICVLHFSLSGPGLKEIICPPL